MKALITASGQHGPFTSITRTEANDGWIAGGCIYPDGVVGADATVGDWVPPPPTIAEQNAPILAQIADLELQGDKPRRRREAITTTAGRAYLVDLDVQIVALRESLKK